MSDANSFHIAKDGNKTGPFAKQDVLNQIQQGALGPYDLAWSEGMSEWQPLQNLFPDEFNPAIAGASPAANQPPALPTVVPAWSWVTSVWGSRL